MKNASASIRADSYTSSLPLQPRISVTEELRIAKAERLAGYKGRSMTEVIADMERIVEEAEYAKSKV